MKLLYVQESVVVTLPHTLPKVTSPVIPACRKGRLKRSLTSSVLLLFISTVPLDNFAVPSLSAFTSSLPLQSPIGLRWIFIHSFQSNFLGGVGIIMSLVLVVSLQLLM